MSPRTLCAKRLRPEWPFLMRSVLALMVLASAPIGHAQEEVPEVISPLRVESDRNDVNLVTGKIQIKVPVLSVPAAPHLRFDRAQNAAPYFVGKQWDGGGVVKSNYSVHTGMGTSESFRCQDFDCTSLTGSGSSFEPIPKVYHQGGSGVRIDFTRHHATVGANPVTIIYYASSVKYPNGEILTYAYDTATLSGDPRTFYRPTRITSNLGYFISISYHLGALGTVGWRSPAEAALYKSSAPTVPLGRLRYSYDGSTITITDLGGRVFTCEGCQNDALGVNLETWSGMLQLPGETTPHLQATALPGEGVVGSVTRDGVAWNYAYTNLRFFSTPVNGYLYDRLTVTGPNGYHTVYDLEERDYRNVLRSVTDSIGRVTEFDFDHAYRLEKIVYPEGNEVSVVYDTFGNITSRTMQPKPGSGLSAVTETAHYPTSSCTIGDFDLLCNRPLWFRDGLNRQADFDYNERGQLEERTDPPDANGVRRKTFITYETTTGLSRRSVVRICGHNTTCNTPEEIRAEYEYWESTFLPAVVRRIDAARGETLETHYTYDDAGRVLVEDGPLPGTGDAKYFRYDEHGRREWEIGPADDNGVRLARRFAYRDADDKLSYVEEGSVPSATSAVLTVFRRIDHAYDDRRNPKRESVSAGGTTHGVVQRAFDNAGRLTCEARRMNPAAFGSLPASACTLGAAGSYGPDRITHNVYDAAGQLLTVQRAYGTPLQQNYATYTYTPNGQRWTVKDANNNLSTFEYDGFDRLSKLRFPVATKGANLSSSTDYEQYGYDAVGNRTSLRKRDNRTIGYTYDALNRLWVKTVPSSLSGAPGYSVHYGYDVQGLMLHARFGSDTGPGITNQYDGFGRLRVSSSNLDGVTRNVKWDYETLANRRWITHPDGAFFEYAYDNRDRLFHLSENGPSITLASIFYDAQGRRSEVARDAAGPTTTYDYDPVSRLELLSHDLDGAGTTNDVAMTFAYNPASQIVTRTLSNEAYEFPITNSVKSYAVNGLNQYTQVGGANHTWDANGNLTSDGSTTFGYDTENRLTSASGAKNATLSYDPLGRLYQVTTPSATTRFLYDGDRLIAEYDDSGALLRRYVHGAGIDEPLVWYEGAAVSAANRRYLHANHQGSIVALTNASGSTLQVNAYDPYGVTGTGNTFRFQYTGQAAIPELGLYYYKASFYNPGLGRFMQTDPVGYEDQMNLYAYVGNDPLNNVDPTGQYGRGSGFTDKEWRRFEKIQKRAAARMRKAADKLDRKAAKLDARGKEGGDSLRAVAGRLRGGAAALESDGSDGRIANAVDAETYRSMGGSENGAAFVKGNGPVMTVNRDNVNAWGSSRMSQWVVGHESLHTAGVRDRTGSNGAIAYKYGEAPQREAYRELKGTEWGMTNADHLMDLVY